MYKALEPGKDTDVGEWVDLDAAHHLIEEAWARHDDRP